MRSLHIQLQPDRQPSLNLDEARSLMESVAKHPLVLGFRITEGFDGRAYVNFDYATENIVGLWEELRLRVYGQSPLASLMRQSTIVVCEGGKGWDDYLQLHHFDPTIPLDNLSEI